MDFLASLGLGLKVAFSFMNLLYCFLGVFLGTAVGVLPGLGPAATISLLLSITYRLDMTEAIILLAGVYYGAMYGGSTTSILVRVPGEAASVVSCLDGYEMAKRGRAGVALGIAAFGSFIAGTLGVVGLMFAAPTLSELALMIGSPEYVLLMFLGLSLVTYLSGRSKIKALMMAALGLILGCIGMDPISSQFRFTFGIVSLNNGLDIPILAMGLFGITEILVNAEKKEGPVEIIKTSTKLRNLLPKLDDWRRAIGPILRGTGIGFFLGILPGGGAIIASFASYALERRWSKHPDEFGKGAIEGLAGPESANNSATAGAFVPLLTLGIPSNAVMALILAAFMIHGVTPGPLIIKNHPEVFWGIVVSMYIGNVLLIILNVPLIGLFVKLFKVPNLIMYPLIILVCLIGAFTIANNPFDLLSVGILGIVGYAMRKLDYDPAPLILAFVVGPILERTLRQSLMITGGDFSIFLARPISRILLIITIMFLLSPLFKRVLRRQKREREIYP
jgi:putative tricarboxylic transport membrane protein